ncbi:MAG: AAA family ATPase [Chthoniobacterales bacterium]
MRLRYLYLPRCGPLTDVAIVFGREELVTRALKLTRQGALNFVVGVNGSGKSSILRAIYQTFTALRNNRFPPLPVTVAWDIAPGGDTVTALLHLPEGVKRPYFVALPAAAEISLSSWRELALNLEDDLGTVGLDQTLERGDAVLGSYLQAHLPKRLVAYTSGAPELWTRLEHRVFRPENDGEGEYDIADERPHGWSIESEWEEQQPIRMTNLLTRYSLTASGTAETLPGAGQVGMVTGELGDQLLQEIVPLAKLGKKVAMNQAPRAARLDQTYFRIEVRQLRYAAIALGLVQAARELPGLTEELGQEALRNDFLIKSAKEERTRDARDLLNKIDWFWPTHLAITYRDAEERVGPRQHLELLCLIALADEVVDQPRGRKRLVISLGPRDGVRLGDRLENVFPGGILSEAALSVAKRVDNCKTGAEAVLRVLSEDQTVDSTALDAFNRLRDWERTGLQEEITLTIKRLNRPMAKDGKPDEVIVSFDHLSDGEQMLLGRMGLLYLLRGQHGSLLLLDEPETHFNDAWKREIVEMIEAGLLDSTRASVLVATHTSIALTDAFAAEVTVLDKGPEQTIARAVKGGLFGTDPGEITMNLFRADSSAGSRSVEILDRLLKTNWDGREQELHQILDILGSSFYRAELRAVLNDLQRNHDAAPPG